MIKVIDTHAHLDEIDDLDETLNEAAKAGVRAIFTLGQNYVSNIKTLSISEKYPSIVFCAAGLHPCFLENMQQKQIDETISFIEENISRIIAIGEIGLDYDKRTLESISKQMQKDVFNRLLNTAKKCAKPVLIHSRYSWRDCFEITASAGIDKAVFHWFTGPSDVLNSIVSEGYYISATPAAEYHKEHQRVIRETPLDRLLLETDSPVSYGRENRYSARPKDVTRSLRAVALIRNEDEVSVASSIFNNTINLFGLNTEIV